MSIRSLTLGVRMVEGIAELLEELFDDRDDPFMDRAAPFTGWPVIAVEHAGNEHPCMECERAGGRRHWIVEARAGSWENVFVVNGETGRALVANNALTAESGDRRNEMTDIDEEETALACSPASNSRFIGLFGNNSPMGLFDSVRRLLGGDQEGDDWIEGNLTSDDLADTGMEDAGPWAVDNSRSQHTDPESVKARLHFREQALEFANYWSSRDLDFTPDSLRRLDRLVDSQWENDRFRDAEFGGGDDQFDSMVFTGIVVQLGGYFGEVLVTNHDATWKQDDEYGWVITVEDSEGKPLSSNVFHIAMDSLRDSSKFADSYDRIVSHFDNADPISDGDPEHEHPFPDFDATSEDFRTQAMALVDTSRSYDLDFSPNSLAVVDDLVESELLDGETVADDLDETTLAKTIHKLGSYFGEVLCRNHDAMWHSEDGRWVVAVERGESSYSVDVFRASLETLHANTTFVDLYDRLMDEDESNTTETAVEHAERLVDSWPEYDLDFSPASLTELDRIVGREFVDEFTDLEADLPDLLSHSLSFGSYFGEVIRRNHDTTWLNEDGYRIRRPGSDDGNTVDAAEVAAGCFGGQETFVGAYEELLGDG